MLKKGQGGTNLKKEVTTGGKTAEKVRHSHISTERNEQWKKGHLRERGGEAPPHKNIHPV